MKDAINIKSGMYSFSRRAKSKKLRTKVEDNHGEKFSAIIVDKAGGPVLELTSDGKTSGRWSWNVETLLGKDRFGSGREVGDTLYLDMGQGWYVKGMKKLMDEVKGNLGLKVASCDMEGENINVFIAARLLLSRKMSWLGPIVKQAIEGKYIPELEKRAQRAPEQKREAFDALIEEYRKYADPRSREYQIFDKQADIIMAEIARKYGLDHHTKDDIAQTLAYKFMTDRSFTKILDGHSPEKGIRALVTFLNRAVRLRAINYIRDDMRRNPMFWEKKTEDERTDYQEWDQEQAVRPSGEDAEGLLQNEKMAIREMERSMMKFMKSNLRQPNAIVVFETWLEAAKSKGPSNVTMNKVFDVAVKRMEDLGIRPPNKGRLYVVWNDVKKQMARFFEKELNVSLSPNMKRKLKIASSSEAVAVAAYRRAIAAWVLGR